MCVYINFQYLRKLLRNRLKTLMNYQQEIVAGYFFIGAPIDQLFLKGRSKIRYVSANKTSDCRV